MKKHSKSKVVYILLPPWHSTYFLFSPIKRKLMKLGFSYIHYEFSPDILSPDIRDTEKYFKHIRKEIGDDMKMIEEKYSVEKFVIIGISLSCVVASMISGLNSKIHELILVVPGNSLAKSLWSGLRTVKLKQTIKKEGIPLKELENDWKELAPENYVNNLKNKKVKVFLSKSDKIIPYKLGKKLAEEIKEIVPDAKIVENNLFGHYGTILYFCLILKDVVV